MEYSNSKVREIIAEYIHSERDRGIMDRRLTSKVTIERLAEEFDVSVSTVKRTIERCSAEIFRHFPQEENRN